MRRPFKAAWVLAVLLAGLAGCAGVPYEPGPNHSLATSAYTNGPHGW